MGVLDLSSQAFTDEGPASRRRSAEQFKTLSNFFRQGLQIQVRVGLHSDAPKADHDFIQHHSSTKQRNERASLPVLEKPALSVERPAPDTKLSL